MLKKYFVLSMMTLVSAVLFTGCGGDASYKDGTYEGKSEVREGISEDGSGEEGDEAGNGYGVVKITVKDGVIADCEYQTFETDGTLKDSEYGKKQGNVANKDFYNKAQKAVAACDEYASQLVASGRLSDVDAISGATINYEEFQEAVENALEKAKE